MDTTEHPGELWRKSSRSNGSGACVEVGHVTDGIGVRDTKFPGTSPVLEFSPGAWRAFAQEIKSDDIAG